ncbi:MAG TPA: helix-turn-helix domain-containing protein [Vicinamibacterales bacterium]|jgi:AraC-like DNA-binding protein
MLSSRSFGRSNVEDIDAMAAAVADGLTAEYVQLEPRPFTGQWTTIYTSNTVVQIAREDVAVVRRLRVPRKRWALIVPITVSPSARWNASSIRPQDALICAPGTECFAFDPAGTRFAVITVETGSAAARRLLTLGADCAPSGVATLREEDAWSLANALVMLATRLRTRGTDIGRLLRGCLARAVPRNMQIEAAVGRSEIVRRVEEFCRQHVGEPLSIAKLSSVAGVSERSLRNAFYDVYTTSPKRYLKLWQLHRVRRALRSATGEEGTVTDVATLHGFYELGRFAGEYKALFGEAPSQTLQKARTRNLPSALGVA